MRKKTISVLALFFTPRPNFGKEVEFPYMPIFSRDWGCQMDPENLESLDVDSEEDLRNDAMYNIMLDKWQR